MDYGVEQRVPGIGRTESWHERAAKAIEFYNPFTRLLE